MKLPKFRVIRKSLKTKSEKQTVYERLKRSTTFGLSQDGDTGEYQLYIRLGTKNRKRAFKRIRLVLNIIFKGNKK